jgi:hypothetical protein
MRLLILLLLATTAFAADTCGSAKRDLNDYLLTVADRRTALRWISG